MLQFTIAEYVWVGGNGPLDIRSKTKVVRRSCDDDTLNLEEFPSSSFDGSQTQQARLESSAVIIEPCATFYDFVRPMIHAFGEKEGSADTFCRIVLCDCWSSDKRPLPSNTRQISAQLFAIKPEEEPWFTVEQDHPSPSQDQSQGWSNLLVLRALQPLCIKGS